MTGAQWDALKAVTTGRVPDGAPVPVPVGFIIDCPWLPKWYGISILEYFSSEELWLEANLAAIRAFPDVIFLPGFWAEYGMCTEPSAFGARSTFFEHDFPHAHRVIRDPSEIELLPEPNPKTDGLLPFVLSRLRRARSRIEREGHEIRFAVARGPLNIATFLMGAAEFLTLIMTEPERAHALLEKITRFLSSWIGLQKETFPTIDGVLLLDDIIGFIGEEEFRSFAMPYFTRLYTEADVSVRFLHNDAPSAVSAPYLSHMGVNLFNMGVDVTLEGTYEAAGPTVALVGNLPPRDILASGTPDEVREGVRSMLSRVPRGARLIASCGGGMPPGVSTENIRAFIEAVEASRG